MEQHLYTLALGSAGWLQFRNHASWAFPLAACLSGLRSSPWLLMASIRLGAARVLLGAVGIGDAVRRKSERVRFRSNSSLIVGPTGLPPTCWKNNWAATHTIHHGLRIFELESVQNSKQFGRIMLCVMRSKSMLFQLLSLDPDQLKDLALFSLSYRQVLSYRWLVFVTC